MKIVGIKNRHKQQKIEIDKMNNEVKIVNKGLKMDIKHQEIDEMHKSLKILIKTIGKIAQ